MLQLEETVGIQRVSAQLRPRNVDSPFLWHFMPIEKRHKLETFLKGQFWFARLDTFGPIKVTREGELPQSNLGLLEKMPRFMVKWVEKQYELAVARSYASCWSKGESTPDQDLWNGSFGGYGNGIAVCTTPEQIGAAIRPINSSDGTGPVYFGSVDYIDHDSHTIPEGNTLEAAFAIRSEYIAEREARVLIHSYGASAAQYLLNTSGPLGALVSHCAASQSKSGEREFSGGYQDGRAIVVGIDEEKFIQSIALGPKLDAVDRDQTIKLISSYGLESKILE